MNGQRVTSPRSYFLGAAGLVALGLVLGLGLSIGLDLPRPSNAAPEAQLAAVTNSAPVPESPFVSVVEKALPAVVFIDVTRKVGGDGQDPSDDFMRRFFGQPMPRQQRVPSSGSGFIIDKSGRILTNTHVVRDFIYASATRPVTRRCPRRTESPSAPAGRHSESRCRSSTTRIHSAFWG